MLEVQPTSRFKKDLKKLAKQGKPMSKLRDLINTLAAQESLAEKHHDHVLIGDYAGSRECHISPDWLLIYEATPTYLILVRTGSHSELFG